MFDQLAKPLRKTQIRQQFFLINACSLLAGSGKADCIPCFAEHFTPLMHSIGNGDAALFAFCFVWWQNMRSIRRLSAKNLAQTVISYMQ